MKKFVLLSVLLISFTVLAFISCRNSHTPIAVTGVEVNPPFAGIAKGNSRPFSAIVKGINDPPQDVIWELVQTNTHPETRISSEGVFFISTLESLTRFTLRATSIHDPEISGTATVVIPGSTGGSGGGGSSGAGGGGSGTGGGWPPSGGGSGYNISFGSPTGGSAGATDSVGVTITQSEGGEMVRIQATANTGFVFAGWNVTSGGPIILIPNNSANPATFDMPANNVTVVPEFVPPFNIDMVPVDPGTVILGREYHDAGILGTSWPTVGPVPILNSSGNVVMVGGVPNQVPLSGFHIGRFPITRGQWDYIMGENAVLATNSNAIPLSPPIATPSNAEEANPSNRWGGFNAAHRPAAGVVSFHSALVFANRLSIRNGLTPAYKIVPFNTALHGTLPSTNTDHWGLLTNLSATRLMVPPNAAELARWNQVQIVPGSTGYRLPSEAQWEFAAKGGTHPNAGNTRFPVSATTWPTGAATPSNIEAFILSGFATNEALMRTAVAWNNVNNTGFGGASANSGNYARMVGLLEGNLLGIHDMSGNVWEWTWGWASVAEEPHPGGAIGGIRPTDWMGEQQGSNFARPRRGGAGATTNVNDLRIVRRVTGGSENYAANNRGFRIARP